MSWKSVSLGRIDMSWLGNVRKKSDAEVKQANIETTINTIFNKLSNVNIANKSEFTNSEQVYIMKAVCERWKLAKENEQHELMEQVDDIGRALEEFKN